MFPKSNNEASEKGWAVSVRSSMGAGQDGEHCCMVAPQDTTTTISWAKQAFSWLYFVEE